MRSVSCAALALAALAHVTAACSDPARPPEARAPDPVPQVYAGSYLVARPASEVTLRARVEGVEANDVSYAWRKIFGPESHVFEAPDAQETTVTGLETGLYEFEVVVSGRGGRTGRDTAVVFVHDPAVQGANEVIIKELQWQCHIMGCSVLVLNARGYLAASGNIRVFVRPTEDGAWIEAVPVSDPTWPRSYYHWEISEHGIFVTSIDASGLTDLKIVY